MHHFVKGISLRTLLAWLTLGCFLGVLTLAPAAKALAQAGAPAMMEKTPAPPAEEKKEEVPTTCGPMISDTCVPIETGKFAMQAWWALSFYPGVFTQNWRSVSAHGNFNTFFMPVKFVYGPTKDLELYAVVPFIHNWASGLDVPGPHGETSAGYSGVGDITAVAKYNLLPEGKVMPSVSAVGGVGFPTGHASHLNPALLGQDAVGTGSFNFITGVNLFKYLKPFLVHGQIWMNTPVNLFKITDDPTRNVRSREYLTANLATELPLSKQWVLLCEVYSNWCWQNLNTIQGYQTPQTVIGVLPGIEFLATEKLALAAGASIDLWGKNGVQKITPMVTAFYTF
ncbi:MAG: transporter [Deltaproteobacteria bacterium]|nr:transporter [Deltaproteobacteria bacterium]